MANYHSDEWIMNKLQYHYEEAQKIVPKEQIVGIFEIGSMNHGLDYENSDVDSKCIVLPPDNNNININFHYYLPTTQENIHFIDTNVYIEFLKQHF